MVLAAFDGIKAFTGKISLNVQPSIGSALLRCLAAAAFITAAACALVTARTYIGDNINCVSIGMQPEEEQAVESYCFISSTFTLSNLTLPAEATAHPGVGPVPHREYFPPGTQPEDDLPSIAEEDVVHHSYYQWVPFLLAMQSMMLYLPCRLWQTKEDGYLDMILASTHMVHLNKIMASSKAKTSAKLFHYSIHHNNKMLFWYYIAYEWLGFGIALTNLFVTNIFLGGRFFYFGKGALSYLASSATDPNNPLNAVFPKVGKCTWHRFGPSGSIQTMDALCVLPLNIVNEKTYVMLWLAYVSLCVFTGVFAVYHLFLFVLPRRLDALIKAQSKKESQQLVLHVLQRCSLPDKFILWCLQGYIVDFPEWMKLVSKEFDEE